MGVARRSCEEAPPVHRSWHLSMNLHLPRISSPPRLHRNPVLSTAKCFWVHTVHYSTFRSMMEPWDLFHPSEPAVPDACLASLAKQLACVACAVGPPSFQLRVQSHTG